MIPFNISSEFNNIINNDNNSNNSNSNSNSNDDTNSDNDHINIVIKDEHISIDKNVNDEQELINNEFDNSFFYYDRCDSPISISNYGSGSGSMSGSNPASSANSDSEDNAYDPSNNLINTLSLVDIAAITQNNLSKMVNKKRTSKYKQLELQSVQKNVDKYFYTNINFTNEIDMLTTFIKGQKNMFIQSKHLSQWKLNCLMLPTFLISCIITIITPIMSCDSVHSWIISGLNALIAFLLSVINYLKLETHTQSFLGIANQYDKLETLLEITNSKICYMSSENDRKTFVLDVINEIEQKILEIKDSSPILMPEEIKKIFPIASHLNIFAFIKKIHNGKNNLVHNLCDIKNEMRFLEYKWKKQQRSNRVVKDNIFKVNYDNEIKRYKYLIEVKTQIKLDIKEHNKVYGDLDGIFVREIKFAENTTNNWGLFFICFWNCHNKKPHYNGINYIIDRHFNIMFSNE